MVDIKQLKKEKRKLEENILTLIQNFQEKHEVNVGGITTTASTLVGTTYGRVQDVEIEMRL